MKNNGMNFTDWHKSNHNPLKGCSAIADAFTKEALQAAFEAGALHERKIRAEARRDARVDNFSFGDTL